MPLRGEVTPMESSDGAQRTSTRRGSSATATLPKAQLVERADLSDELMVIKLKPETDFTFKPGQYCTLGLKGIERAYSIASAPEEGLLEIFVELVPLPDGMLTPLMWEMKTGDYISIRPRAKGIFTLDEHYNEHLMVATVTGVAPFISIIRSYLGTGRQGHKFYVLQGASYQEEFAYKDELQALSQIYPETLAYVPTVSRPEEEGNAGWQGPKGRVNAIVEEYIGKFGLHRQSVLVYACGHPGMIEDVKDRLVLQGYRVKEERFWKQ